MVNLDTAARVDIAETLEPAERLAILEAAALAAIWEFLDTAENLEPVGILDRLVLQDLAATRELLDIVVSLEVAGLLATVASETLGIAASLDTLVCLAGLRLAERGSRGSRSPRHMEPTQERASWLIRVVADGR